MAAEEWSFMRQVQYVCTTGQLEGHYPAYTPVATNIWFSLKRNLPV